MKYQFFEAAGLIVMLRVLRSAWEVCLCLSVCVCVADQTPNLPGWNPSPWEEQLNPHLLAHPTGESGCTTTARNVAGDKHSSPWSRFILGFTELRPRHAVGLPGWHCLLSWLPSWPPLLALAERPGLCLTFGVTGQPEPGLQP